MQSISTDHLGHTLSKSFVLIFSCLVLSFSTTNSLAQISIQSDVIPESCGGYNDASITLNVSGGVGPYTVNWTTSGATGMTQTDVAPGIYEAMVTDTGTGETVMHDSVVTGPETIVTYFDEETSVNCSSECVGTASLVIEGGTPPYTFDWPEGAIVSADGMSATGLCFGTYSTQIFDANGCDSYAVLLIEQPINTVFLAPLSTDASCSGNDGTASVDAFNGTPPYTYLWENGETTSEIVGLAEGTYTVAVTDNIGCTTEVSAIVGSSTISATVVATPVTCFDSADGTISVNVQNGTAPYTFDYAGMDPNALPPGDHEVTVTDANNCAVIEIITITEPLEITLSVDVNNETCMGCADGMVTATAIGGTEPFTYSFLDMNSANPVDASNLSAGSYEVQATDMNGCYVTASFEIETSENVISGVESIGANQLYAMTVYPNPVTDFATLNLPKSFDGQESRISLIDISGKVYWTETIQSNTYLFQKGNTTPGVYIIEAVSASEKAFIKVILE